ncbi:MAG: NAD-dependent epimerase/dehydratase family protein [Thaumarchaeota archaeon]|nr:NAD-dependent epimerase/dehydratase family protein [Nitrososphaerota archaeon]
MKILVTGDQGFIAKRLIWKLDRNFTVFGIDVDDFRGVENWGKELLEIVCDISPDVIFHVGACSDTLEQNVNYMMELNYESTKILADYCNMTDCKMIYSSSAANYGINGQFPSNLYGWSKYAAEDYVISHGGVALRYFNVYGPGEEHKGKMASVAYQSHVKHSNGETVKLFPKRPTRDFVHVDDIVSANIHAMAHYQHFQNNWFEVGSGESRAFEDVLNLMEIPFEYLPESAIPQGYQFNTVSNPPQWLPGWMPKHTIDTGVPEYVDHLQKLKTNAEN